jgi:acyl-coenzyme A thioesterase PaaI-like protein
MDQKAFQDYFSDDYSQCYGCGRLNEHGLQIKSYWEGDESVCRFEPWPQHVAVPGFVYGGLIASLIDCHGTGTAAGAAYKSQGRQMGTEPEMRFVTASLHVDYLKPTPLGGVLELRARAVEIKERKVVVDIDLHAEGEVRAKGRVVAVLLPQTMYHAT